jgi:predicted O-methyltransferase YrrM
MIAASNAVLFIPEVPVHLVRHQRNFCLAVAVVAAIALLAMLVRLPARAAAPAGARATVSDETRAQIIRDFRRTGLNTTPEDAMLLRVMIAARSARRGVEVGSATGYGAINMGVAFERNGGRLYTLEIDPAMARATRANIEKMGLQETVTVVEGDALVTMPKLEGEFDFVFIDAHKPDYLKYLKAIEPKLKVGAVVVSDNVIASANQMRDFLDYIHNSGVYETVTVRASDEKKDGMAISVKLR